MYTALWLALHGDIIRVLQTLFSSFLLVWPTNKMAKEMFFKLHGIV